MHSAYPWRSSRAAAFAPTLAATPLLAALTVPLFMFTSLRAQEEAPPPPANPAAEAEPVTGISDNSFFIEEAYNQEPGVVQHIQSLTWSRDREGRATARNLAYSLIQEWPIGGMRHQGSITIPFERLRGDQPAASGLGDVLLNYRCQVWMETDTRPAFAPRLSLLLPVGDEEEGLGAGSTGAQVNLPLSKKVGDLHLHLNAGFTAVPSARRDLPGGGRSESADLFGTHFGFSSILLLRPEFNILLEFLASADESIGDTGEVEDSSRALFSPGMRYAINTRSGAQWVLGAALPIGVSEDEDDFGFLAYLSIEHPF